MSMARLFWHISKLRARLAVVNRAITCPRSTEVAGQAMTYRISDDGKSITCLVCGRTSHNPHDVSEHYCGFCHFFHDDEQAVSIEEFDRWMDKFPPPKRD